MNREMICLWLGLAGKQWPPDPYALLGLNAAECDAPKIEQRVQERMAKLRCYQLSHPDEATEAMNRVAQAFIALVERHCPRPEASAAPTESLAPKPATAAPKTAEAQNATAVAENAQLDWQSAPPR